MSSYKEMYYKLFNRISDVIGELQALQLEAEEMFMSDDSEPKILKIPAEPKKADKQDAL